ncbi:MAG: hypothetical protein N2112_16185 [Gemmataceae bacterium]|jgi:hypothetical protein|nr:hypothetical protein [Gemmataceae bacterium]
MGDVRQFLEAFRKAKLVHGHLRGLFHVVIGRRIATSDGTVISTGITWRQLAEILKDLHWDKDYVIELGLNPQEMPLKDRTRYWYQAISAAKVLSVEAQREGDQVALIALGLGFQVGPSPL